MAAGGLEGRRRLGGVLALVATSAMLALALGGTGVEAAKAKKNKEVSINQVQYCHSCILTIEEFFKETQVLSKETRRNREDGKREIDGNKIIDTLCESPRFYPYRPEMKHGCMKLRGEFLKEVFAPLNGEHDEGITHPIVNHKRKACVAADACKEGAPLLMDFYYKKKGDQCDACKTMVSDIETLLYREKDANKKNRKRLSGLIDGMCEDVPLRHDDDEFLRDFCEEFVDEVGPSAIAGTIILRNRLSGSGMQLSQTLSEKVCSEMADYCPKPSSDL